MLCAAKVAKSSSTTPLKNQIARAKIPPHRTVMWSEKTGLDKAQPNPTITRFLVLFGFNKPVLFRIEIS
jgi:hypothetical protein